MAISGNELLCKNKDDLKAYFKSQYEELRDKFMKDLRKIVQKNEDPGNSQFSADLDLRILKSAKDWVGRDWENRKNATFMEMRTPANEEAAKYVDEKGDEFEYPEEVAPDKISQTNLTVVRLVDWSPSDVPPLTIPVDCGFKFRALEKFKTAFAKELDQALSKEPEKTPEE